VVPDLTVVATPLYFGTIEAERRLLRRRGRPSAADHEPRDTATNLLMGTASLVLPVLTARALRGRARSLAIVAGAAAVVTTVADRRGARSVSAVAGSVTVGAGWTAAAVSWRSLTAVDRLWGRRRRDLGGGAVGWLVAFVGWDLVYYWNHRFMHEVRAQWAHHVVHHSSERYNLSVALRQPVAESFGIFVPYGLLAWAGVRPSMIERSGQLNLLYQYWIHTDVVSSLGRRAESLLNSPSAHRVHHGSNRRYLDRNHGGILILWDRLFGTHQREDEPVVYGLTKDIGTFNPARVVGHEWVALLRDVSAATCWRDRLGFLVRRPGWSPPPARVGARIARRRGRVA
jgi:sterol desaturase/sphingolipid hydroxylase (fatty acid hydroxylase superfamily)